MARFSLRYEERPAVREARARWFVPEDFDAKGKPADVRIR